MSPSTSDGHTSAVIGPTADKSLVREMAAALALVVTIDVVAVAAFGYLVAPWVEPYLPSGTPSVLVGGVAIVAVTGVFLLAHLRYARRGVLAAVGAKTVSESTHPNLHARITRLAAQFDLRPPELAVVDTDVPNSLAVGGPRASTVVISRGLIDDLSDDELDAVLAHELAHVKNRDATVMTLASVLPALANGEYSTSDSVIPSMSGAHYLIGAIGLFVLYVMATPRLSGTAFGGSSLGEFLLVVGFTLLLGGVLLGLLAAPAVVLTRRLSRRRELVADTAGARATGDPAAMASAIRTLADEERTRRDLRSTASTLSGLCFLPYGFSTDAEDDEKATIATQTHPSVEDRLENLRTVTATLES
ncbi:zn-dependent protease with chaperone function [Halogeometricum borinquense]|uniref:Zn-dependent protease with chaperone function n=1 Tax=Halogeometricum borinquense TaxID=60847 RepID=A0A482TJQ8_9EURY|nr:M48 family metalloprotease [Halogeometricum borinquense]RYJ14213.1 zn-dependent protease with chaperone function [Halogeometricum borinquense]